MGYLGDNLEDYYGFQLMEQVIFQLKSGLVNNIGDIDLLRKALKEAQELLDEKFPQK